MHKHTNALKKPCTINDINICTFIYAYMLMHTIYNKQHAITCTCMVLHSNTCKNVQIHKHKYTCKYRQVHLNRHTKISTHTCNYKQIHIYIYACKYSETLWKQTSLIANTQKCTHMHAHTCTYIHIHIHTHKHTWYYSI